MPLQKFFYIRVTNRILCVFLKPRDTTFWLIAPQYPDTDTLS